MPPDGLILLTRSLSFCSRNIMEEAIMQPMLSHVAGVDVHKDKLTITAIIESQDGNTTVHQFESPTFTDDLIKTGLKLLDLGVTHVAMESTGIYWKPIHHIWKPMGLNITLGNAAHLKNVPGRKTDMNDSHWIATLHRNGLIRPSYVPEQKYQELRMLTRHRQCLVDDASRLKNRAQKILEDGNIKLSSVISDVFGVAGRLILESIAQGNTDKLHLASLAKTNLKRKEDLPKALSNTLTKTQCILIRQLLSQFDSIQLLITEVEQEISNRLKEHSKLLEKLDEIPGIDRTIAQGIIAEATADMSSFKNDRFFAAWTGVAPGNNESANKKKEQRQEKEIPL